MGKSDEQNAPQPKVNDSLIDELKQNGTINLTASTREELIAKFEELKASAKDVTLMTGAVGRSKDNTTYSLQVDVAN